MERLSFNEDVSYNAIEASIHLNRYLMAKPFCKGKKVLDAACGAGYGSYLLKSWGADTVHGLDIDEVTIETAKQIFKSPNLFYAACNIEQLPFENNEFDVVVSLETIEHLDDPEQFLKEIKRVLKPDGVVILSCPNDNYYYERDNTKNPFHKSVYNFYEFKQMAENILGNHVNYFLAFALDGFMHMPYERRTEPEMGVTEDQFGIFHNILCDEVLCVPQERYLNQWNSNYYVGIWGKPETSMKYSAVITPRETFIDHKDKDYDLLHHLDKSVDELKILTYEKETLTTQVFNMKKELAELYSVKVERDRIFSLLELTRKENSSILENLQWQLNEVERLNALLDELERENEKLNKEVIGCKVEKDRLLSLLELTRKERDVTTENMRWHYENSQNLALRVQNMEASRGVQLLGKWYNLKMKIKRLLRIK